jgi:hypothetical protein
MLKSGLKFDISGQWKLLDETKGPPPTSQPLSRPPTPPSSLHLLLLAAMGVDAKPEGANDRVRSSVRKAPAKVTGIENESSREA